MAQSKSERLMNLVIALLVTRQFLSKDQIRDSVAGYRRESADESSFDRMFERDKKELRELGITIETGSNDAFFDDEAGYRIRRDEFELADIHFTSEEAAVVGLAAQVWQHAGLAGESSSALLKLKAAGVVVDTNDLSLVEPYLSANEPSFDEMWKAATRRIPIRFTYERPGRTPEERFVQPWGVLSWRGRWYMVGFDIDRNDKRVFRLSRVEGDVVPSGPAGSYETPAQLDLNAIAAAMLPQPATEDAVIHVRRDRCQDLRRKAESVSTLDEQWDAIAVKYAAVAELAAEIASFGPDAVAISPPAVRSRVVDLLHVASGAV